MFVFGFHNSVGFNQKLEELEKPQPKRARGNPDVIGDTYEYLK